MRSTRPAPHSTAPKPSASGRRSITRATPSSPEILGQRASVLKPLLPMLRKPTRALSLRSPLSPARSSRLRSCRPNAKRARQSSARRERPDAKNEILLAQLPILDQRREHQLGARKILAVGDTRAIVAPETGIERQDARLRVARPPL